MRRRNREIQIFNLSMLDVISGAMGAFLIVMVVLLPSYRKTAIRTADGDDPALKESLQAQVDDLIAQNRSLESQLDRERQARANLESRQGRGGTESEKFIFLMAEPVVPAPIECTIGSQADSDLSLNYRPGRPWMMATSNAFQVVRPRPGNYRLACKSLTGAPVDVTTRANWSGGGRRDGRARIGVQPAGVVAVEVNADGSVR